MTKGTNILHHNLQNYTSYGIVRALYGVLSSIRLGRNCAGFRAQTEPREEVIDMARNKLKPGQTAPASGQYGIIGSRGGDTGKERTVVRGEPMPPTPKSGQSYRLVDRTRNKAGQGKQ